MVPADVIGIGTGTGTGPRQRRGIVADAAVTGGQQEQQHEYEKPRAVLTIIRPHLFAPSTRCREPVMQWKRTTLGSRRPGKMIWRHSRSHSEMQGSTNPETERRTLREMTGALPRA